jgi:hypothetical protein
VHHRGGVAPEQGTHLGAQPFPDAPDGIFAGLDQRHPAVVAADVEPEEVAPLADVDDLGLGLVEDQAARAQPLGQVLPDLFRVLATAAERQQVVRLCRAPDYADPGRRLRGQGG